MTFFIVHGKDVIKMDQHVTESEASFYQRVEFIVHALGRGHSVDAAHTLSYAYQNKLQYKVTYPALFEEDIKKIIDDMT